MRSIDETREAIRKNSAKQSAEMQKKRESRPGPVKESGGISLGQRFKNWLNEDRLPKYMQQPGQDEYGRSKKAKAETAAQEIKKNSPPQKSAKYSSDDIRAFKSPRVTVKDAPRRVGADIAASATQGMKASATAPKPAAAKPKAAKKAAFRPESKEDFMAGLGEDSAVTKFLRKKEMEDSISKGAFKKGGKVDGCITKGGKVDGCITKGGTKGRYI